MPCRNLLQATPSLWVSDSLLAEAFHRFARVSHAHRRYGSNVPGPLEARRRHAKRRMGMATPITGPHSSPFDFGALFGLGGAPPNFEQGLTWEPPSTATPAPLTQWQKWPFGELGRSHNKVSAEERVEKFLKVPEDTRETCKADFQKMLGRFNGATLRTVKDIQPLLDYLQSSSNHRDAWCTLQLVQWLKRRQALNPTIVEALRNLILQKSALDTIGKKERAYIFAELFDHSEASRTMMRAVIEELSAAQQGSILSKATGRILSNAANVAERKKKIEAWLDYVRSLAICQESSHSEDPSWRAIYRKLARYFRPSDLATHFSTLEREDIAILILQHWAPRFVRASLGAPMTEGWVLSPLSTALLSETPEKPPPMDYGTQKLLRDRLQQRKDWSEIDWEALIADFKVRRDSVDEGQRIYNHLIFLQFFRNLAMQKVPYNGIMVETFRLLKQIDPPNRIRNLFWHISKGSDIGIPIPLAASLVRYFINAGYLQYAFQIFFLVPTLPLSRCPDLVLRLIEQGKTHGDKILWMLQRRTDVRRMSRPERNAFTKPLKQRHIDLVHQVAYAWAASPHVTARVAFRRVYECYRLLCARGIKADRLMSRAFIKAGIVRSLREGKPLSKRKIAFILRIVDQDEGPVVAKWIDRKIFEFYFSDEKKRERLLKHLEMRRPRNNIVSGGPRVWKKALWLRKNWWQTVS